MAIFLQKASHTDCETIHSLQIKSFAEMLDRYQDYSTSPGAEDVEKIIERMNQDATDYYFIRLNNANIGGVRVVRKDNQTCRISQMFIVSEFQGKGYAQQAIVRLEAMYAGCSRWELDTIKQESRLCHLYEKMGYHPTGNERELKEGMTLVDYVKQA